MGLYGAPRAPAVLRCGIVSVQGHSPHTQGAHAGNQLLGGQAALLHRKEAPQKLQALGGGAQGQGGQQRNRQRSLN